MNVATFTIWVAAETPHDAFTEYIPLTQVEVPPSTNECWKAPVDPFTGTDAIAMRSFEGLSIWMKTAVPGPGGGDTIPETTSV